MRSTAVIDGRRAAGWAPSSRGWRRTAARRSRCCAQLARRLIALAEMRAEIDGGASVESTLKRHRIFCGDEAPTAPRAAPLVRRRC